MKKNGFAPLLIILIITILGVAGYLGYKNTFGPSNSPKNLASPSATAIPTSEIVIPNVINQWAPQVTWEPAKIGKYQVGWMDTAQGGVIRRGTILDTSSSGLAGNGYSVGKLFENFDQKLIDLGWTENLPEGASGPFTDIRSFTGYINGVKKTLVFEAEVTDNVDKKEPPYNNSITVFQEQ